MHLEVNRCDVGQRRVTISISRNTDSTKTLIIAPAMGVKSAFYKPFASFFFSRGFNCVLIDYHGMFHEPLSSAPSDISSFGKVDLTRAIEYTLETFNSTDLYFLGHSIAGQVLPLAKNASLLKAAYLVASQSVDVSNWSGKTKVAVNFFWGVSIPIATRLFGYLPSWTYGGKHHLSKSVARDWARLARTPGGMAADTEYNRSCYENFNVPTKFISIENDDLLAPRKAVVDLCQQYGSAVKEVKHLKKHNSTANHVDHFSFFRNDNAEFWDDVYQWFGEVS